MNILPKLMAWLTGQDRYLPEITWSKDSWVHNIFRAYEKIFWRKVGIRAEMTTSCYKGRVVHQAHSFEAACALIETQIRNLFEFRLPIKIWIPQFSSPIGLPSASPFMFAIGFDAVTSANGSATSSFTFAHTCTGSNLILFAMIGDAAGGLFTAATYNAVSMSQIGTNQIDGSSAGASGMWNLVAPATGSNNVVFSISNPADVEWGAASSYTGAAQTGQPDSHNQGSNSSSANITITTTVVASNCWLVGIAEGYNVSGPGTFSSSQDARAQNDNFFAGHYGAIAGDTNGTVGTGSQSMTFAASGTASFSSVVASFAPVPFSSSVLKVSSVPQASIKKIMGVTNANARKIAGVQNQP
jgi:hypothetical protein